MPTDKPTIRIALRYALLQTPGLLLLAVILIALMHWADLAPALACTIAGLWVAKDALLFRFLWRFYDPHQQPDRYAMIGRRGVALSQLDPEGYARIRGERWRAVCAPGEAPIAAGTPVRVEAVAGLQVTVRPDGNLKEPGRQSVSPARRPGSRAPGGGRTPGGQSEGF